MLEGQCPVYGNLRDKYDDLENDENLIKLFNEILAMRQTLEEEEMEREEKEKEEEMGRERKEKEDVQG